jgi:antitoxin CptB
MNNLENLKKKIIYRSSYRGTKEMDILLSSFVNKYIEIFSPDELVYLDKFLDYEDEVILNYYQNGILTEEITNNKISTIFKKFKL